MRKKYLNRAAVWLDNLIAVLIRWRNRIQAPDFYYATEQDVVNAYRLFLNRLPDLEGYSQFCELVKHQGMRLESLTDSFLYSDEFQTMQAQRNEPVLVQLPDYQIYVRLNDYFIGAGIAEAKQYEPHVTFLLQELLQPGMVFLDVGANIGYFSLLAAQKVGQQGKVIAFEPVPANCALIQKSIAVNGFEQISLHPFAVADIEQEFALAMGARSSNSRIRGISEENNRDLIIQAVIPDAFLSEIDQLDVIKLDIEGAEPRAIAGMQQLIRRFHPHLVFEYAPDLIELTSQVDPLTFLREIAALGYDLYHLPVDWRQPINQLSVQTPEQLNQLCHGLSSFDHIDIMARPSD